MVRSHELGQLSHHLRQGLSLATQLATTRNPSDRLAVMARQIESMASELDDLRRAEEGARDFRPPPSFMR